MSAPAQESAAGKLRTEFLDRPARFEVTISIWKSDDTIGVGHVEKFRIRSGRIESDTEWLGQSRFGKDCAARRFPSPAARNTLI